LRRLDDGERRGRLFLPDICDRSHRKFDGKRAKMEVFAFTFALALVGA
jgi:hypothetical protein